MSSQVFPRALFAGLTESTQRRLTAVALWSGLTAIAAYLFLLDPAKGSGYIGCPFRALTGFDCPGCGTLRGLHQLLHAHPLAAFKLNPMMVVTLPFIAYSLFSYTSLLLTGKSLPRVFLPARYIWMLLVVVLGYWVFRNTAIYPFPS
jgi:Protein of unknown function (DUF2752)